MSQNEFEVLHDAYVCLLRVPIASPLRTTKRCQRALSGLRDLIAKNQGMDSETVQAIYEALEE